MFVEALKLRLRSIDVPFIQEPAPEKKPKRKVTANNNQYAGPGSFIPAGNHSNSPSESHSRQASDVIPSHMRMSNHGANLYVAPYENNWNSQVDGLTQDFSDFRLSQARRRESFPVSFLVTQIFFHLFFCSSLSLAPTRRHLTAMDLITLTVMIKASLGLPPQIHMSGP